LRDGTPTLPLILAAQEDEVVHRALGGGPQGGALVRVAQTGALERSRELAIEYAERARSALDGTQRKELESIVAAVLERRS
jgi:geranylgeranyl pyrophosphate synthase